MRLEDEYAQLTPRVFSKNHFGFINSLAVDPTGKFLLCGGADSAISIWELDRTDGEPSAKIPRHHSHDFGVSKVSWWPQDPGMFLSGSFDSKVCIWDTRELETVYTFKQSQKVYSLDVSVGGLVSVGMDHPFVQILDLRAGGATQTLKTHSGKIHSVKWSPNSDNLLATAGSDGTVRIWDIRRAEACVTNLDLMRTSPRNELTPLAFRKAHRMSVNGLSWYGQGYQLLSVGNDNKVRLWDLTEPGGMNMAVNFGPLFQNRHSQTLDPCLSPEGDLLFDYVLLPSDTGDILMLRVADGRLVRRLEPPKGEHGARNACVVSRGAKHVDFFSGNANGAIIRWRSATRKRSRIGSSFPHAKEGS